MTDTEFRSNDRVTFEPYGVPHGAVVIDVITDKDGTERYVLSGYDKPLKTCTTGRCIKESKLFEPG